MCSRAVSGRDERAAFEDLGDVPWILKILLDQQTLPECLAGLGHVTTRHGKPPKNVEDDPPCPWLRCVCQPIFQHGGGTIEIAEFQQRVPEVP